MRGCNVMRGYLDDPQATAAAIDADGWLHTGDIGTVDERGYVKITDRLKDMYIAGGFNVFAWSRGRMANYKVPAAVHLVVSLPVNAGGKVIKFQLREQASVAAP